jgi:hypothetical protein
MDLSKNEIEKLMGILSERDNVRYTSHTVLHFSRPAICLVGDGVQKTISVEVARQLLKESDSKSTFTDDVLDTVFKTINFIGR